MLIVIDSLEILNKYFKIINPIFKKQGLILHQSYYSFEANFISKNANEFIVFFDNDIDIFSAFEKKTEHILQCSIPGFPILCNGNVKENQIEEFIKSILVKLNSQSLYFPLVYDNMDSSSNCIKNLDKSLFWNRLPNPIVKTDFCEESVWKQVVERYGSRAFRQRKKFEKNLYVKDVNNRKAEKIISRVELNSWKRKQGQDMLTRDNQFKYYTHLIKTGIATVSAAFDLNGNPVAYRIDSLLKGILYVLKWSYDDEYSKYSPGFYLLTIDLFKKYKNNKIRYIDLFGSPDKLKSLLETSRIERIDICYPNSREIFSLREERLSHDTRVLNNFLDGKSIKQVYKP